jgi:hypothetical protein
VILRLAVGVPVVVTVKVPFTLTVNVALLALVICGGVFTVILTVDVTLLPAALVTVNVYVVVTVGETLFAVPLVTAPTPLFTLPVPLLNTAVRVVELPVVIVVAAAVKLVTTGAGTIVSAAGVGAEELLKVPWMCAVALLSTEVVVTLNCAADCPARTVTVAGTTAATLSLLRATESPPVAAGPLKVTVAVVPKPPVTVDCVKTTDATVGGFTVNVAVFATP